MTRFAKYGWMSLLAVACSSEEPSRTLEPGPIPAAGLSVGVGATVQFVKIEGGCWALQTSDGYYEPMDLPEDLRTNGKQVRVWISQRDDMVSVCQIAPIVQVDSAVAIP